MKYYLTVGERSGDMHAANLMHAIQKRDPDADFRFLGGDEMAKVGGQCFRHYKDVSVLGLIEIISKYRFLKKQIRAVAEDIKAFDPDVLIMIDFSEFNLRVADLIPEKKFKSFFYIAPKTWAYLPGRTKKLARNIDHLLCILPFEVTFFNKYGIDSTYVGNPLLDQLRKFEKDDQFKQELGLDEKPIISILPGSRYHEVGQILKRVIPVIDHFPDYNFVVAGVSNLDASLYDILPKNVKLVYGRTYDLLSVSEAAVVASGTATLETALFKVPQVVVYYGNTISMAFMGLVLTIPYVSLANLVAEKRIVQELLQFKISIKNLKKELNGIVKDGEKRAEMMADYDALITKVGDDHVSENAAEVIISKSRK